MSEFWLIISTVCFSAGNQNGACPKLWKHNSKNQSYFAEMVDSPYCIQQLIISTSSVTAKEGETIYRIQNDTKTFCEIYGGGRR